MPWGKHKGIHIRSVPLSYLAWLLESGSIDSSFRVCLAVEIRRRMNEISPELNSKSSIRKDLSEIVRRLSVACHPDLGGSQTAMKIVNELREAVN